MEDPEPSARVQDKCAWCGHALSVATRSWEGMRSDHGRVITANYCSEKTRCATRPCSLKCEVIATSDPDKVVREISNRQKKLDR